MKLKQSNAPYISHEDNSRTFMINVILSLIILYAMAFFFYGPRVLLLAVAGFVPAVISEWVSLLLFGKKPNLHDLSASVTGLLIPLMLPATIPFKIPVIASIFAITVAKHPFGGTGQNVFNPAAAGYAFIASCFSSDVMFKYPTPRLLLPFFNLKDILLVNSPAFSLNIGGIPNSQPINMALGYVPGPMGATSILVLLACLIFLISRRTIHWQIPIVFLSTTSIISLIFLRIPVTRLQSLLYENMSGLLLFGAVFILADPVTTPKRVLARISYAMVCGILVMIFRHVGRIEETFMYAVLIMNATVLPFDLLFEKVAGKIRRGKYEAGSNS